jgi:hypothetical protein
MRNYSVCIYLVKAAERDVVRETARALLRGIRFSAVYTPHFAMCTDTLSEILLTTGMDAVETRSVMRFCCSGLFPRPELNALRARMDEHCRCRPETVGLWFHQEPEYFDRAAAKANQSLQKTLKEVGRQPGESFNVMVVNNDTLPLLELVASEEYDQLPVARPGDLVQFRYEVAVGYRGIMNWQLVHAFHYP